MTSYLLVTVELIIGLLSGLGLIAAGAGEGSWILGGIVAGALVFYVYRSRYHQEVEPNRNSRKIGQVLIGLTVGCSIKFSGLVTLPPQLPIFILLTLGLLLSSGAIAYIYSRLEKTDALTALLATVPGNIGIMASIAADYERNTSLVSLVQLIRFTAVTLVIPIIASVSNAHDVRAVLYSLTKDLSSFELPYLLLLGVVLSATFLAVYLGTKLKIPVATFFCPIVVGIGFNVGLGLLPFAPDVDFNLPTLFKVTGQILLGITIGEYWGVNPKPSGLMVVHAAVPAVLTLLVGFISAGVAMIIMPWNWLTCLLVTAPGGSPEMIWIALALNHDVEIVTAGHLVRLMAINLSLPVLVSLSSYLDHQGESKVAATKSHPTPEDLRAET